MPIVAPANVAEYLEFGLYGWALSRYSGKWVGLTALSEVVESGATVDLDAIAARVDAWRDADAVHAATGYTRVRPMGCTTAGPTCRRSRIESRLQDKLDRGARLRARQQHRPRRSSRARMRRSASSPPARRTTTSWKCCGGWTSRPKRSRAHGVRIYKLGLTYPIEPTRMRDVRAAACARLLVIEEKGPVVEGQLRDLFYNAPAERPLMRRQAATRDGAAAGVRRSASCGRRA